MEQSSVRCVHDLAILQVVLKWIKLFNNRGHNGRAADNRVEKLPAF